MTTPTHPYSVSHFHDHFQGMGTLVMNSPVFLGRVKVSDIFDICLPGQCHALLHH
jgi:hypothetical protein